MGWDMQRRYCFLLFFIMNINFSYSQQTPIPVEPPTIISAGSANVSVGISHFVNQQYPLSGLEGNLLKIGNLRFGFSYDGCVELQFDGTVFNILKIHQREKAFNSNIVKKGPVMTDAGDFTLWTKFLLLREENSNFNLSFRFGVQLPNTSNESGLGLDVTNFYSLFLLQKYLLGMEWTGNFGLGILEDPTLVSSQHDVIVLGIQNKIFLNTYTSFITEISGRVGHQGVGVRNLWNGKFGIETSSEILRCKLMSVFNFSAADHSTGVELTLSYPFQIIH